MYNVQAVESGSESSPPRVKVFSGEDTISLNAQLAGQKDLFQ